MDRIHLFFAKNLINILQINQIISQCHNSLEKRKLI